MADAPNHLRYTRDHEWSKLDGKIVTVGLTAFAGEQLGDIVFLELPKKGSAVKAGGTLGAVESTKAVSDVFSPVTGTVVEVNSGLTENPEIINQDPYQKGWLVKIELTDVKELDLLMDAAHYQDYIQTEGH